MTGLASDKPGEPSPAEQALHGTQERVQQGVDTAKAKGEELREGAAHKAEGIKQ